MSPTAKARWLGRITDEPFDWCYMLGTAWAEKRKPVWLGFGSAPVAASDSGSVAGSDAPAPAPVAEVTAAPAVPDPVTDARIAALEAEIAALKETVAALRAALRAIA